MLNRYFKFLIAATLTVAPLSVLAQTLTRTSTLLRMVYSTVTDVLIPLVFTLGLLAFFYGVVKYIWSEGQGKEDGKKIMIWGVIALFVMSSVWGLVYFIKVELNIGPESNMPIPTIGNGN